MESSERVATVLRVTGRVQGVGFRMYAAGEARRTGVVGWVRNEPDGSVAAHAEGTPPQVDAFVGSLAEPRNGFAAVSDVDVEPATVTGATSFEIRY